MSFFRGLFVFFLFAASHVSQAAVFGVDLTLFSSPYSNSVFPLRLDADFLVRDVELTDMTNLNGYEDYDYYFAGTAFAGSNLPLSDLEVTYYLGASFTESLQLTNMGVRTYGIDGASFTELRLAFDDAAAPGQYHLTEVNILLNDTTAPVDVLGNPGGSTTDTVELLSPLLVGDLGDNYLLGEFGTYNNSPTGTNQVVYSAKYLDPFGISYWTSTEGNLYMSTTVPVPGAAWLFASAITGVVFSRRRKPSAN